MERQHLFGDDAAPTPLERVLSESLDKLPDLIPGVESLRGFKFNPPDSIVPYLVAEYGLNEIAEYMPNLRDLIHEGIQWQRIIGTPAAIHKALQWINHDGDIEEFAAKATKWWWFQIHLPFEVRNTNFVRPLTHLVKASKPLRSEFARVTAGHDVRAFRFNKHRLNGTAGLNNWSGIKRTPDEPVLSLRVNIRRVVVIPTNGAVNVLETQNLHSHKPVSVAIPTSNPTFRLAAFPATRTDYRNKSTVQFQNAPFVSQPFGAPVPRVQTGSE
ncbi:phage tail protein [Brucella sp. NBRC 113783]|uniref:phage tail protein n=1 Tax=Brucella sp. NBRC 113783 TaxID=3075478 RepID=UPI0029BFDCD6|nr:phage tail protein [Brucella sp. NBRC 113783]MDX4074826.1 phage tail protein [Brucella sp. NBRC 113783]